MKVRKLGAKAWLMSKGGFRERLWKWKDEAKQEKVAFVWDNLLLPRVREWKQGDQSRFLRDFCRGINIPEIKFHDLRATFITGMLSKGVALECCNVHCGTQTNSYNGYL